MMIYFNSNMYETTNKSSNSLFTSLLVHLRRRMEQPVSLSMILPAKVEWGGAAV